MMEQKNRHPLDCITCQSGLSMLECLIPFVDYPLKLPLALFIKFNEIRLIINAFHSMDSITKFGLNEAINSPTDMLCSLTGMSKDMLNMILSMTSNDLSGLNPDLFSSLSGMGQVFSQMQNHQKEPSFTNFGSENLNDNIANIFAEYDMQQAAEYAREQPTEYPAYSNNPSDYTNIKETYISNQ